MKSYLYFLVYMLFIYLCMKALMIGVILLIIGGLGTLAIQHYKIYLIVRKYVAIGLGALLILVVGWQLGFEYSLSIVKTKNPIQSTFLDINLRIWIILYFPLCFLYLDFLKWLGYKIEQYKNEKK